MAEPTLAEQMVTKYQAALLDAPAGVEEVTVEGNRLKLADVKREYGHRVASPQGLTPIQHEFLDFMRRRFIDGSPSFR
jgi:hypothetical protein